VSEALNIVTEVTRPEAGKKALAGNKNASKADMMRSALVMFPTLAKWFEPKRGTKTGELENRFEHVADAIGAFAAARSGTAEKLVVQLTLGGGRV
jgi:hypothetical protein